MSYSWRFSFSPYQASRKKGWGEGSTNPRYWSIGHLSPRSLDFLKACSSFLSLIFPMHTCHLRMPEITKNWLKAKIPVQLGPASLGTTDLRLRKGVSLHCPAQQRPSEKKSRERWTERVLASQPPRGGRGPHLLDFQWALSPLIAGPHQAVQASVSGRRGPWVCGAELPPSVWSRPLAFCPLGQSVRESGQAPASAKDLLQLWASVSPLPTRPLSTRHLFNIETNGERGGWCQSNQRIL